MAWEGTSLEEGGAGERAEKLVNTVGRVFRPIFVRRI